MRLRNPGNVWKKLEKTCQSMATSSIDAKLLELQNIQTSNKKSSVECVNRLDSRVSELFDTGRSISEEEKLRSLLRGLHKDFSVAAKVI